MWSCLPPQDIVFYVICCSKQRIRAYGEGILHFWRGSSLQWCMREEGRGWQRGWGSLPQGQTWACDGRRAVSRAGGWVSEDKTRAAPAAGIRGVSMGTDRGCSEGSSSSAGLACWPWRVRPGIKHSWRVPFSGCKGWAKGSCRAPKTTQSQRRPAHFPRPRSEWVSSGGCNAVCGVAARRLARCLLPLGFSGAEPPA